MLFDRVWSTSRLSTTASMRSSTWSRTVSQGRKAYSIKREEAHGIGPISFRRNVNNESLSVNSTLPTPERTLHISCILRFTNDGLVCLRLACDLSPAVRQTDRVRVDNRSPRHGRGRDRLIMNRPNANGELVRTLVIMDVGVFGTKHHEAGGADF